MKKFRTQIVLGKNIMFGKSVLVVLLSCATIACTTTKPALQKELEIGGIPQFDGYISPITIPIKLRYKPAASNFKIAIAISVTENSSTKNKNKYFEMTGKYKLEKFGDMLIRDTAFNTPNFEIEFRELMDNRGKVQEAEATSPDATKKDAEEFEGLVKWAKNYSQTLPENPVQSGDTFIELDTSKFISDLFSDMPELSALWSNSKHSKGNIVEGWGFFNGKKVLVVSMDNSGTAEDGDEGGLQIKTKGYALYDAETLQPVELRSLFDLHLFVVDTADPSSIFNASIKMLLHWTEF